MLKTFALTLIYMIFFQIHQNLIAYLYIPDSVEIFALNVIKTIYLYDENCFLINGKIYDVISVITEIKNPTYLVLGFTNS